MIRLTTSRLAIISAVLVAASQSHCFGGAWTLLDEEYSLEFYNNMYYADHDFDADGDKQAKPNDGEYTEYKTELKLEYGLTDDVDLLLYAAEKWEAAYEDNNGEWRNRGLSDIRTGLKFRLAESRDRAYVVSAQVLAKLPAGYDDDGGPPPLGTGQVDIEGRLLYGQTFLAEKTSEDDIDYYRAFAGLELGYRFRAEDPSDQLVYFAEAGYLLGYHFLAKIEVDGVEGLSEYTGGVDEDYTMLRAGVAWGNIHTDAPIGRPGNLSIGLSYGQAIAGKSSAVGREVILKALIKF